MLRLWGRTSSINVRKVVWAAQELSLELQRTDAGGQFGLVREAQFLSLNPNGLVPLIEDESTTLWESNTIVRYLCARHAPGDLYPEDLPTRFLAEQWMDWQQTTLNPAGRDAFLQWIRTPAAQRDPEAIARSVAATEPLMELLDAHLARHAYLAGDRFTMADIPVGCEIHRWWGLPQERPARPHLERWFSALRARSGALGVLDQPLA
ncbi:glutathione S-transferase [Paracidovorax citrulli]|uniref:Glutathione S-transferase, C-terminal domain protein n=2 Tax=Paracidovorax citrulli TaxID=80869 RepID=A1TVJ0_PARC0|nr:glutathione S-transferase [Paracidovorax citrulli]ABM34978.1 glutathione S-transferase, C-terminal domain protein [Paracidovorax citrulli AAC00-1]ATG96479.1 glutathione S-transferase [Paracidovorax citrulli]MVT30009.1 glutathione S-transferase [Paracidovorax citrulli]MVT37550.1 glutathione S-transferase [Paracidovorax citrulli]PVY64426.1 glutathione S-transferase [Paracidovorax citrulli]